MQNWINPLNYKLVWQSHEHKLSEFLNSTCRPCDGSSFHSKTTTCTMTAPKRKHTTHKFWIHFVIPAVWKHKNETNPWCLEASSQAAPGLACWLVVAAAASGFPGKWGPTQHRPALWSWGRSGWEGSGSECLTVHRAHLNLKRSLNPLLHCSQEL